MRRIFATFICAAALAIPAVAQVKDELKTAGQDTKHAGKDVGEATKDGAKKTGKAVKKGTKKTTHAAATKTEEGADRVRQKSQ